MTQFIYGDTRRMPKAGCAVWGEECDGERKEIRIVTEFTCEESGSDSGDRSQFCRGIEYTEW